MAAKAFHSGSVDAAKCAGERESGLNKMCRRSILLLAANLGIQLMRLLSPQKIGIRDVLLEIGRIVGRGHRHRQ